MAAYCTLSDLLDHIDEPTLAGLLDDTQGYVATLDATATARLTAIINQCSEEIETRRRGHIEDVTDSGTLTSFRSWCVPLVLEKCYARRGHYGSRNNPWAAAAQAARLALRDDLPSEKLHLGSAEEKTSGVWSSSEDSNTDFLPLADSSGGTAADLLRGMGE